MIAKMFQRERPFIVFDLETTGPNPDSARIVQVAMRVHQPDGTVKDYKSLVNPKMSIPKESTEVHGITDEMVKDAPKFADLASNFHRGFTNADFGGYNVKNFDLRCIQVEFARCNLKFDYSQALVIDGFRFWQKLEPRTLTDAFARWVPAGTFEGAHDAMNDVQATEAVILAQLLHAKAPKDLKEIHDLCFPRNPDWVDSEGKFVFIGGVPCLNFGKNKGKPMRQCKDYLQWMYGADFSPEIKRICDEALAGRFPVAPKS
jgi:DNA polymerase-3 subunit epsilon